jgi:hypothetical protein
MSFHEYYHSLPTTILHDIFTKMIDLQKQIDELRILITNQEEEVPEVVIPEIPDEEIPEEEVPHFPPVAGDN